jgi:hypothetical protein
VPLVQVRGFGVRISGPGVARPGRALHLSGSWSCRRLFNPQWYHARGKPDFR